MSDFKFTKEDLILYILNKLEPEKSTKLVVNKIAFFVEFGYMFKTQKPLSDAEYAGIPNGPVINNYKTIFDSMQHSGKIKIDGWVVRPLVSPGVEIDKEVSAIIDPIIEKYSDLNVSELVTLSHATDSYKITTDNEKVLGKIIDKDLAQLETFFDENLSNDEEDVDLPSIDFEKLEPYDFE